MLFISIMGFVTLIALFAMLSWETKIIMGIAITFVSTASLAPAVCC